MSLQYKFFSIPVTCPADIEDELNDFLKAVRTITIHRELISQENRFYWAIAVEYMTGSRKDVRKSQLSKKKIDYKEVLSPENFSIFAKLRDWRKETAGREAVQLYNVFMNDQLAAMVEKRITTKAGLRELDGVGDARVEKYGDAVLAILKEAFAMVGKKDETGKQSV